MTAPRPTTAAERRQHRRAVEVRYAAEEAAGLICTDLRRSERLRRQQRLNLSAAGVAAKRQRRAAA